MTEKETIEYYRNKINQNNIIRNVLSERCEFSFGKEASLEADRERLFKDRKCDYQIYPFGRGGEGIYVLVNDSYVAYIKGNRSAQRCGIIAKNVKDFFNIILKLKCNFNFLNVYNFKSFSDFKEKYDEDKNYLTSRDEEENSVVAEFLKENEFETDLGKIYEMFKSALATDPEFIMEDIIYNEKVNDLFQSNHKDIDKLRNINTVDNKIVKNKANTNLPKFKYHPNIYNNEIVFFNEETCQCCGKTVSEYIENIYSASDVDCICFECIANGTAAKKFDCTFVQDAEKVSDPAVVEELFQRTPGYGSWQGEYWLACCDDYCEYVQSVGIDELDDLGITKEVLSDYKKRYGKVSTEDIKEFLDIDGDMMGHLFKCRHCGKYHLWVDSI